MIWTHIKRGFGYGLGGRIGWELGGLVRKIAGIALLAVGGFVGVPALSSSLSAYEQVKQRYEQPVKAAEKAQGGSHARLAGLPADALADGVMVAAWAVERAP